MPGEFKAIDSQLVEGIRKVRTSQLKFRGRRLYRVTLLTEILKKPQAQVIDKEGSYNSRPYFYTPRRILPITLYEQSGHTVSLH